MQLATVVIDPPSIAALSALFVIFMARSIAQGAALKRSLLVGGFIGAWFAASFGMHAFKYPAWMLCYLADPRSLPTLAWYPVFFAVMIAAGALGAYGAHRLIAAGSRRNAWLFAVALGLLWIALFALTLKRYLVVGTYDEFWAGTARRLNEQPGVMRDFNVITAITASGPLAALVVILRREFRSPAPAA